MTYENSKTNLWFLKKIKSDECWEWLGCKQAPYFYGRICFGNKVFYTHRWMYEQVYGKIPEGYFVCHKCDNPPCMNPHHLFVGTHSDNMNDCKIKGRARNQNSYKKFCKYGHEFTKENTSIDKKGSRICKKCKAWKNKMQREAKKKHRMMEIGS